MGKEAKTKPQAWKGTVTLLDRLAMLHALEAGPECPTCKAGKMTFEGDPKKVDLYNRAYRALQLAAVDPPSDADGKALTAQLARLSGAEAVQGDEATPMTDETWPEPIEVTLENDLVRFLLVDVLGPRARWTFALGGGVIVYLSIIKRLLEYAADARLGKIGTDKDDDNDETDDVRELALSERDRETVWAVLKGPAPCKHPLFQHRGTGASIPCGRAADGPRDTKDLEAWCRLIEQLDMDEIFQGWEPTFGDADEVVGPYLLDVVTGRVLLSVLTGRLHLIEKGPKKLGDIIAALEAYKGGAGKPKAPEAAAIEPTVKPTPEPAPAP